MSLFGSLFGSGSTHSAQEKTVSRDQIRAIVSQGKINTLSSAEEKLIEGAIDARRRGDGKISVAQIDEALRKLESERKISQYDRKNVVKAFATYFEKK